MEKNLELMLHPVCGAISQPLNLFSKSFITGAESFPKRSSDKKLISIGSEKRFSFSAESPIFQTKAVVFFEFSAGPKASIRFFIFTQEFSEANEYFSPGDFMLFITFSSRKSSCSSVGMFPYKKTRQFAAQ